MINRHFLAALTGAVMTIGATSAQAVIPIYGSPGVENPLNYTFTAATTGNITVYFAGSNASFEGVIGLLVNGVSTGITGLNNQTSAFGDSLVLGAVNAGDVLTFTYFVTDTSNTWSSRRTLNADGLQHIFSAASSVTGIIPAGTLVSFEDKTTGDLNLDFDYNDTSFVFDNVGTSVPEPAAWALMIGGFAMVGAAARRRRAAVTA